MKKAMTQADRVKEYMERHGSITSMQAFRDLKITRLAARISDLKKMGVKVGSTSETSTNEWGETARYARYYLMEVER